jgi:hypothetical protein
LGGEPARQVRAQSALISDLQQARGRQDGHAHSSVGGTEQHLPKVGLLRFAA